MPRVFLALLLLWLACPSWALTPASLDSDDLRLSLGPYTGYYEDIKGTLNIEQVQALDELAGREFEPCVRTGEKASNTAGYQLHHHRR